MKRFAFLSMLVLLGLLCVCTASNKKIADIEQKTAEQKEAIEHMIRGDVYFRKGEWGIKPQRSCWTISGLYEPDEMTQYHYKIENYDKAIAEYNDAIRLDPMLAEAYYVRGIAYSRKGDDDRAIKDYEMAVLLDPAYTEVYAWLRADYNSKAEQRVSVTDSPVNIGGKTN